jgi:hypothetical protein
MEKIGKIQRVLPKDSLLNTAFFFGKRKRRFKVCLIINELFFKAATIPIYFFAYF